MTQNIYNLHICFIFSHRIFSLQLFIFNWEHDMVIYQSIPVVETSSDNRLSWLSSSIHSLPFLFFKKKPFLYLGFFLTWLLLVGLQSNHVFFRLCRARPTISMDLNLALTRARRAPWALCEGITERTVF